MSENISTAVSGVSSEALNLNISVLSHHVVREENGKIYKDGNGNAVPNVERDEEGRPKLDENGKPKPNVMLN